jgi:predicted phosphodiesterase
MKILLVSDEPDPFLWDYYQPGRLDEYDLILSAGDLEAEYLSFLVTMAHAPLLYVHGNHNTSYDVRPPEGCDCIEDRLVTVKGLRILGLGGSAVYSGDKH